MNDAFDFNSVHYPTEPVADFEDITPDQAAMYLLLNIDNRVISDDLVNEHVRAIKAKKFMVNGETIKFSVPVDLGNGVLRPVVLDGQHRLTAIAKAGVTVRVLVVRGLALDTKPTIDAGRKRSAADNLRMLGRNSYVTLAATASAVWRINRGDYMLLTRPKPTSQEVLALVEEFPSLYRSVEVAGQVYQVFRPLRRAAVATAHHLIGQVDPDQLYAPYFFELIKTGENLKSGHPVMALRQRATSYKIGIEPMTMRREIGLIVKAWNRCAENKLATSIIQPATAPIPEVQHPSAEYLPLLEAAEAAHG
jgi:hypothetical protein